MAYQSFKPTVWAATIETDLQEALMFAEDTNRNYEGSVKNLGDSVKILGVERPTISTGTGSDITLSTAEEVTDTSLTLPIDHYATFNYAVGDIDELQASGDIMGTLSSEATYGMAEKVDTFIGSLAAHASAQKLWTSAKTDVASTNILGYLDAAIQKLYENNVPSNEQIVATVPPWFYTVLKQALITKDTDNTELLKKGIVMMYGNVAIKMSNNVYTDASGNSLIQVKTKKALAFAQPKTHVEPYRPDLGFKDCLKGFVLYGGTVARPKEMVVMNCKQAS